MCNPRCLASPGRTTCITPLRPCRLPVVCKSLKYYLARYFWIVLALSDISASMDIFAYRVCFFALVAFIHCRFLESRIFCSIPRTKSAVWDFSLDVVIQQCTLICCGMINLIKNMSSSRACDRKFKFDLQEGIEPGYFSDAEDIRPAPDVCVPHLNGMILCDRSSCACAVNPLCFLYRDRIPG